MRRRPLPPVREEVTNAKSWPTFCDSDFVIYGLVGLVGALCYTNSLNGEFVHDDIPAIVSNGDVNGENGISMTFVNDFWGTPMSDTRSHKSYRPLTTLSFRLNHILCGLTPWWWHACNVALHAVCCVLVARVGAVVARLKRPFDALAALLFAVHPVHTEAVAGVVGRADVLACVFFLSSVLLYHGNSSRHRVGGSIAAAALSMFAKESGLTVLMFNVAFDLYKNWSSVSKSSSDSRWRWKSELSLRVCKVMVALSVLLVARLLLLQGSFPSFSPQDNPPAFHQSLVVRILTFSYLAAFNWWLLLCPWSLSHDWQMGSVPLVTSVLDPRNLLTAAAVVALVALSYRCLTDFEFQRHSPAVSGLLLLVLPYLPASNVLVTVGFVVAERVLYMPSVGSTIVTAYGIQLLWSRYHRRPALVLAVMVVVGGGVARTYLRNGDWRTKETLLRADLAVLPHNAKLHYNFGNFLKDMEQQENAIKHYKEALRLWPSYASAHNNLGTLVVASGQAEHHFLQALKYNKNHVNAHYNLGKLYRKKNRFTESLHMLERCIELEPRFVQAYLELLLLKPEDQKQQLLLKIISLEPNNWEHHMLYGNWLRDRGARDHALPPYLAALCRALRAGGGGGGGGLAPLRAAASLLRAAGQRARLLQLLTRWHAARAGPAPPRSSAMRAWQVRAELAGRARRYTQHAHSVMSTCLHHSHLELSTNTEVNNPNEGIKIKPTLSAPRDNNAKNNCQKLGNKKTVSVTAHKNIYNKSDSGAKEKSCPLHRNKNIATREDFIPYLSDHLIKTY